MIARQGRISMAHSKGKSAAAQNQPAANHGHNLGEIDQHGRYINNIYQDKPDYLIYGTKQGITVFNPNYGPRGEQIYDRSNKGVIKALTSFRGIDT